MNTRAIMKKLTTGGMDVRIRYVLETGLPLTIHDLARLYEADNVRREIHERVKAEVKKRRK